MIIIPAIDILDNECVRLYQGNYDKKTVYAKDPTVIAQAYEEAGAKRIHIVDLNSARSVENIAASNNKNNRDIISKIRKKVSCIIEVGGGIRTDEDIRQLREAGVDRLILGTILAKDPDMVGSWVKKYGSCFIAGIDALDGRVKVSGWESDSGISDIDLAVKAGELGINEIIYTNISRDGALSGPDIQRTLMIAEQSRLGVILSGGIGNREDVENVVKAGKKSTSAGNSESGTITGIIIGKAIYEQKVSVRNLIESFQD